MKVSHQPAERHLGPHSVPGALDPVISRIGVSPLSGSAGLEAASTRQWLVSADSAEQLANYFQKYWLVMERKLFSMPPVSRKLPLVLTFHQPHNANGCKCIIRNNSLGNSLLFVKLGLLHYSGS